MGIMDYAEACRERRVTIEIGQGLEWGVLLRKVSRADLLVEAGQLNRFVSEQEIIRLREEGRRMVAEEGATPLDAAVAQRDIVAARMATATPEQSRETARERLQAIDAAVRLAVVGIDTGEGMERVRLVKDGEARTEEGVAVLTLDHLPAGFATSVWTHVQDMSTSQAKEVAAVVARFRADADGASPPLRERSAADATAGAPGAS